MKPSAEEEWLKSGLDGWFTPVDMPNGVWTGRILPQIERPVDWVPDYGKITWSRSQDLQWRKRFDPDSLDEDDDEPPPVRRALKWSADDQALLKMARDSGVPFQEIASTILEGKFTTKACQRAYVHFFGRETRCNSQWTPEEVSKMVEMRNRQMGWCDIARTMHRTMDSCQTKFYETIKGRRLGGRGVKFE